MNQLPMSATYRQVDLFHQLTGHGSGFRVLDEASRDNGATAAVGDGRPRVERMSISFAHPKLDKVRRGVWIVQPDLDAPPMLRVWVDEDGAGEKEPEEIGAVVYRHPDRFERRGSVFQGDKALGALFDGGRNAHQSTGKRSIRRWWPQAAHDDPIMWTVYELLRAAYWRDTSPYQGYMDLRNW